VTDLDFDLNVARDERGTCRLTLRGELDLGTAEQLERALADAGDDVVLDLRGLTFMDSTGVRMLLEAADGNHPGPLVEPGAEERS
jgi:anti-anti-sigma factor